MDGENIIRGLQQKTLFSLCKKHNWDPLFFSSIDADVNLGDLDRELEVCSASRNWSVFSALLKAAREKADASLLKHLANFDQYDASERVAARKSYFTLNYLLALRPFLRHRADKYLRQILSSEMLKPEVFGRKNDLDIAERWGLEMKFWYSQGNYKIAASLGQGAARLKLKHQLITHYLKISALSLDRSNRLIVLKGIQKSPNRTRAEYEKAIIDSWSVDPDCSDYLELLRKVLSFRMRKKGLYARLSEDLEQECVDLELNKKLATLFLGS